MNGRRERHLRLDELLADVEIAEWSGDPEVDVTAVVHDSHDAVAGACFACIPGAVTDGHDHAEAAIGRGATSLLVERILPPAVSQARVADVRAALGPVAAHFHGFPSRALRCLGVTGTNGKTTTTYLLEAIARAAGERVGVVGTVGARVEGKEVPEERTTPEATELQALLARMRAAGVGTVAMEVSSHAIDQHRVDGTWFAAVGFTNLSHEHLDYHGTVAAYFEAKARLFESDRAEAAAVNIGDARGPEVVRRARAAGLETLTFRSTPESGAPESTGIEPADLVAEEVELAADGNRFVLVDRRAGGTGRKVPIRSPLIGRFNVDNALAAAGLALAGGLPFEAVVTGLADHVTVPGRLERVEGGQPFTVLVDYAHTPDALARVLDVARSLAGAGRVLAVFGCGGDRDREKRPLMGRVAGRSADLTVLTSDNPRSEHPTTIAAAVAAGLRDEGARFVVEPDRRAAIRFAVSDAQAGDAVVIAGKGHETGQTIGGVTRPFDDRVVAREELEALGCA
ncbi:MAG: UDP-N-acetylmuramoyl-L-alanyl-D-glutamate--2,6-diaminopimelate ligase [Acidimicrobiia bacterium]